MRSSGMLVFRMPMSQIRTPTLAASSSGGWRSHKPLGRFWVALVYGIVSELGPWACPLTLAENYFEARAGIAPYQGPFLLHLRGAPSPPRSGNRFAVSREAADALRHGREGRGRLRRLRGVL